MLHFFHRRFLRQKLLYTVDFWDCFLDCPALEGNLKSQQKSYKSVAIRGVRWAVGHWTSNNWLSPSFRSLELYRLVKPAPVIQMDRHLSWAQFTHPTKFSFPRFLLLANWDSNPRTFRFWHLGLSSNLSCAQQSRRTNPKVNKYPTIYHR